MGIGDWGLGIGDWGLGIGDWAQSPIPNPQSPIFVFLIQKILIYNIFELFYFKKIFIALKIFLSSWKIHQILQMKNII